MNSIIFYDFETTGLNPFHSNIIEYAFINDLEENLVSLVNPDRKIEEKITKITGIDDSMVKNQTFIENHRDIIFEYLKNIHDKNKNNQKYIYLIAHNNDNFDKFFFKRIFKGNNSQLKFINDNVRFIDRVYDSKIGASIYEII